MTPQPKRLPTLELVERCWRVMTVAGQLEVRCSIYRNDFGLEVRVGPRDNLLYSHMVPDLDRGRAVATECRRLIVEDLGGVTEVPLDDGAQGHP